MLGRESGANFGDQSQSVGKQNQSKRKISFDTHLKTNLQLWSSGGFFFQRFLIKQCTQMNIKMFFFLSITRRRKLTG